MSDRDEIESNAISEDNRKELAFKGNHSPLKRGDSRRIFIYLIIF